MLSPLDSGDALDVLIVSSQRNYSKTNLSRAMHRSNCLPPLAGSNRVENFVERNLFGKKVS